MFKKEKIIEPSIKQGNRAGLNGFVDEIGQDGIRGWLVDAAQPGMQLGVTAFLNEEPVGSATCQHYRGDISTLFGVQVYGGFAIRWDWQAVKDALKDLPDSASCAIVVKASNGLKIACKLAPLKAEFLRYWAKSVPCGTHCASRMSAGDIADYISRVEGQQVEPQARTADVKLIAYYLPQFHPIPENDEWWGPGFTEWTNVSQAQSYYEGHYQPHVPGELGYYDLRLDEVREAQAALAREHGIYGFCYYYYWFGGRRLLERPLQAVLESGKPDFPFCICWANENWSRRWDGSESEILVQQVHDTATDEAFIRDVIPLFKDPRYIRLNGAPLLVIYRLSLLPAPVDTAATWRRICAEEGIPQIHLCMAETFGLTNPYNYGFDSAVQFPPHGVLAGEMNSEVPGLAPDFSGKIYAMRDVVGDQISRDLPPYKRFPGVMPSWDNTARKKRAGNIFMGSSPALYETWLRHAISTARTSLPVGEQLVFINAWNEWAEGAHLEPDRHYGRAYLEGTRRALTGQYDWQITLHHAEELPQLSGEVKDGLVCELRQQMERLSLVNSYLLKIMGDNGLPKMWVTAKPGQPFWMADMPTVKEGRFHLDQINHFSRPTHVRIAVDGATKLYIYGWSCCPPVALAAETPTYLMLRDTTRQEHTFFAIIPQRHAREDVCNCFKQRPREQMLYSGIKLAVDISTVTSGMYTVHVVYRGLGRAYIATAEVELEIS